ncbi:RecF/RecN/SMC [Cristinia sonorae]|uniref:Structural maintenance of chromosomes protein n=1 Tax=Cristinia sonorae TaxID=1940300 RepID=A0A8K0XN20_9AGAR|nr:RecF/RecN/SMC [Cristinia sonorae]
MPTSSRSTGTGRSIRSLKSKQKESSEHEEPDPNEVIEDSEDELLGSQRPPSKRVQVKVEIPEPSQPPPSRRQSNTRASYEPSGNATASRSRKPANHAPVEGEEVDEPEPELPPSRQPPKAVTPLGEAEEEEEADDVAALVNDDAMQEETPVEEEKPLLDAIPNLPQSQPVAEEGPQGPKARLVIHKMALVNFKSYAGRQEIGPFHKSFSSIVGPNGSGKSNTIDALLFVFGYRATKMRQGKLSELIHNSARYPDLEECSVEVHFREIIDLPGPDAYETVLGSQLIVTRTAYKNNSSRYTINGRQSSYKEVQALLKGRGIDLDHNRFLILQGEVESIAQMKPKAPSEHEDGLLEYLEDIIGTSALKAPIEEALAEMDRLNEDRAEKLNRLKIVERERNALEEQKREAEDYLRLQNEHVRATSRLWQWYIWRCFVNEENFNKKIAELQAELDEEIERNEDDITHLELLEKHFEERSKAYEEVKVAAAAAIKDLQEQEKRQVGLEERRKHAKAKEKKLKKSLQEDEHARNEAVRAITDNANKMEKEKAKADEFEESLATEESVLEQIRDSLKDKTQVFHDKIEEKQKELQPWTAKINSKKTEIDIATSERDDLVKKAESVKASLQEAQGTLEQLEADQRTKEKEMQELHATKNQNQRDVASGGKELEALRLRVQELRSKASSSRQKAEEAKASQQASTSQNKVLDSLNRLKGSGRISGFHGRLGSLGTIPDKYDVAISTACSALNNLVVDTVEQGQACIEYLRKQNVGRASFMVLEKLSAQGLGQISTPENVPRLFDLIKPKDPRFAPAFYKGVRDTLVAQDLDQANRIAFGSNKRWRVVTLAGQLIDSSGTMSGGGTHVSRGGMSSKLAADSVSPEVLRGYEQDSEHATHELEQAQQQFRNLEAQLEDLSRSVPRLDTSIEKLTLDIRGGEKRIAETRKRVSQLKAQSKPDAGDLARIASLDRDITSVTEELEELQEKTASIEKDIADLEKKILEIGGAKLLAQKSKVDGIRLHINLANDEITKAEVAKAKAEKDSVKLKTAIENNRAALTEAQNDIEELEAQLTECNDYVEDVRSKVNAAKSAQENSKDDLDNLKAELDERTEGIQAFRQKEMALKQKLGDTRKEAAENGKLLDHWQLEHDKLKLEDIDDDDDEEDGQPAAEGEAGPSGAQGEDGEDRAPKPRHNAPSSHELRVYSVDELSRLKKKELIADTELLDEKLKNARPNLSVLKDYRKREEEFLRRASDLENVTKLRDEQKQKFDSLTKQRLDEFMNGFSTISLKLKEMYQMITLGGNAELELVDSMDPFAEGIIFSVMPPKKSWRNISNLSGGEKTLSSLALVFALHVYKPTPLYFMDEIDAALDFRNVSIVANYIKDRTKNAQFIIISLRNDMFELSHRLIGIYKTSNATRSISIDNHALHSAPLTSVRTAI